MKNTGVLDENHLTFVAAKIRVTKDGCRHIGRCRQVGASPMVVPSLLVSLF
jgi:hypothetical protein